MKRRTLFAAFILTLMSLVLLTGEVSHTVETRVMAAPEFQKEPLFQFHNKRGRDLYKRGATLPAGLTGGPWENKGPVCLVAREPGPQLKPIYMFRAAIDDIVLYGYDDGPTKPGSFNKGSAWANIGVEFYVASTQLPGTVPLYGASRDLFYTVQPSVHDLGSSGTYRLTTDHEIATKSKYDHYHGILGYVWTETAAEDEARPDLTIVKTYVRDNGIEAIIRNQGNYQVSSQPGVSAVLTIIDKNGKPVYFSGAKQLGGMSPNQQRPVLFETGKLDLARKQYRVQVDAGTLVAESNENNNDTGFIEIPGPKMKINPLPADFVRPPGLILSDVKGLGNGRMNYTFSVTNWDQFKPEWFQSLENVLPPGPCGGGDTNARLVARTIVIHNSVPLPVACKPLNTQQELSSIVLATPTRLGDSDQVRIYVEDRATGSKYESSAYPVGVFGVDKILVPMGCKFFLGRASSYICSSDQGFAACENMRQKGKPIECRKTGKPQP